MRLIAIADLHANRAATDAVFEQMRDDAPDAVICLGDLVGYNAEPREVIDRVRDGCDVVVAGNHDVAVIQNEVAPGTRSSARAVQSWTRATIAAAHLGFLQNLPRIAIERDFVAVHGCYLNTSHVTGYVTSTMLEANLRAIEGNGEWPRLALCGHTHIPITGWLDGGELVEPKITGEPIDWPADASAVLVNPGSVGQPRDRDPRAAYAVIDVDARRIWWRRVAYDIDATCGAIEAAGLPEPLGARLREGT